jgi:FkbM family methyltransferase
VQTATHPILNALNRGLLLYGTALPYHTGKSRIVETLVEQLHLDRLYHERSYVVRRRGITWKLSPDDLVQRSVYYCSYHEAKETMELSKLVRPDWTFFDVGSYFGYYSLLVSQLSGGRATVHAFEPFSSNYDLLLEHKAMNGFDNVHTHRLAISNHGGEVEFQLPRPSACQGGGWVIEEANQAEAPERTQRVRAVTLDDFVAERAIDRLDFIKVDTEGAEINVLTGAADTVRRFRPGMFIEVNPEALARYGRQPEELRETIREMGYLPFRATRSGLRRFDDFASVSTYCNVFCFPTDSA